MFHLSSRHAKLRRDGLGGANPRMNPNAAGPTLRVEARLYLEALDRRGRFVTRWEMFYSSRRAHHAAGAHHCLHPSRARRVPRRQGTEVEYGGNGSPLVIFNLTGQPALVVPAGLDHDGLPIGVQIAGPRWSEMRLLAIARAHEEAGGMPGSNRRRDNDRSDRGQATHRLRVR